MDDGRCWKSDNERWLAGAGQPGEEGELELGLSLSPTQMEPAARTLSARREGHQGPFTVNTLHAGHSHPHIGFLIVPTGIGILHYSSESLELLLRNSIFEK